MAAGEKDDKEKMLQGLMARAKQHMDETPSLRRLSAVMRGLRGEMQRRAAEGLLLTPLGAHTDETEAVTFLDGTSREEILVKLQEMAFVGRITTGGLCILAADILEIHGEERDLPKMPILCFEPLHPRAEASQPLKGRKKKSSALIFAPADPAKVN